MIWERSVLRDVHCELPVQRCFQAESPKRGCRPTQRAFHQSICTAFMCQALDSQLLLQHYNINTPTLNQLYCSEEH